MNMQIERNENQGINRATRQPEYIAGALGDLDMVEGSYCPVTTAVMAQKQTSDLRNRWLAAMIFVVGMGSLSLQHRVMPSISQPVPPFAAPAQMKAPSASAAVSQKHAAIKLDNLQAKLDGIMKRADVIDAGFYRIR